MPRRSELIILCAILSTSILYIACRDGESPLPTQAGFQKGPKPACLFEAEIEAIFPPPGLRNAASNHCENILKSAAAEDIATGVEQLGEFIDFSADQFNEGDLTGSVEDLLALFGLLAGELGLSVTFGEDVLAPGTVEVIEVVEAETATIVQCESDQCAVDIPDDAFEEETVIVCKRLADDADPLSTAAGQFPRFFDCSATTQPVAEVTMEVCVFDPPDGRAPPPGIVVDRMGHEGPNGFELLEFVAATNVACDNVSMADGLAGGLLARAGDLLGGWASRLGLVRPLSAVNPGGLGGLAGSLSPFGGVATGIDDGFEATPTAWGASGGTGNTAWRRTDFNAAGDPSGIQNQAYVDGLVVLATGDGSDGFLPPASDGAWVSWYGDPTLPAVRTTGNYMGVDAGDAAESLSGGTSAAAHAGRWTSDPIRIPDDAVDPTLRFQTWWEVESVDTDAFDLMRVIVIDLDAEGAETELGVLNPETDPDGPASVPFTSGGFDTPPAWVAVEQSLDGFQGREVRIAFEFSTGDVLYNGFRGWVVDEVQVFDAGLVIGAQALGDAPTATLNPVPAPGVRN